MTSKIKVDNIANQSDSNIVNKCSTTITVGTGSDTTNVPGAAVVTGNVTGANVIASGNVVKSNALQASDAGNIISQSGTTITLGASGDTIALSAGASQTGFGRTGTVDWQTSSIKTSTFTAANGEGYFANTSGGAFTMNLPAGSAGAIISVVDYTNTFQTNALTVAANGSEKIGGIAAPVSLSTQGQSVTLVYVDGTEGWKNTMDSTSNVTGNPNLIASVSGSGNTLTTVGDCKIATFTGPGSFTVANASQTAPENVVSYLIIGGGGGGGGLGGGGGGGGFREFKAPHQSYPVSPRNGSTPITVTAQAYSVTIGAGGNGRAYNSVNPGSGAASTVFGLSSAGGGGGGSGVNFPNGGNGGSGGGGNGGYAGNGGNGNTPPVSPSQGEPGGNANNPAASGGYQSGGGGGATEGSNPSVNAGPGVPGRGGQGTDTQITSAPFSYAGGGGGGGCGPAGAASPCGTGGAGGTGPTPGSAGATNKGGGGGGTENNTAGNGGSGIVIIRYKFQ